MKSAQDWMEEGARVAAAGDLESALECFQSAVVAERSNPYAWFNTAVALTKLERLHEALDAVETAVRLAPEDEHARRLKAGLVQALLPPGRPGETALAMFATGGMEAAYVAHGMVALMEELRLFDKERIAVVNWWVATPAGTSWETAADELLCHIVLKDARAFAFRYEEEAETIGDEQVEDADLDAAGALLETGVLKSLTLAGNRPFTPATRTRVTRVNARLDAAGVPEDRRLRVLLLPWADED